MPAGRSAVAQCPFCCNPRLEVVGIGNGRRSDLVTVFGYTAFDDGSYDPGNPTAWAHYGKVYASLAMVGEIGENYDGCSTCPGPHSSSSSFEWRVNQTNPNISPPAWSADLYNSDLGSCVNDNYSSTQTFTDITDFITDIIGATVSEVVNTAYTATISLSGSLCDITPPRSFFGSVDLTIGGELAAPEPPTTGTSGQYEVAYTSGTLSDITTVPHDPLDADTGGIVTSAQVQSSVWQFQLQGAASTAYDVEIFVTRTTWPTASSTTETSEVVEVTTDSNGEALFDYTLPQPPIGFQVTYEDHYTITPA